MKDTERPPILHWREAEGPDAPEYGDDDERMAIHARLGQRLGLTRIGVNHERLPPGRRTSYPHAESAEDEFVFVLEGTPDVWIDGVLHRLRPGDGVGFPAGTGICHSFLNNTGHEVRLLVIGETPKPENRIFYPLHPERRERLADWWEDPPERPRGPHDGLTDAHRSRRRG